MNVFLAQKTVRARKRHRCFVCGLSIWPGQTYVRSACVNDGSASSFAEHHECRRVAMKMLREDPWIDGYIGEDVGTYLHECGADTHDELRVQARKNVAWALHQCRRWLAS